MSLRPLPAGIAVILFSALGSYVVVFSGLLNADERRVAEIVALTRAVDHGSLAVIVKFSDVVRILERVA